MKKIVTNMVSPEAKRLREFRKAEGLTLKELAPILSRDYATLSRYENGEFVIPIDVVKIMHEKFFMSLDWFFTGKGNRKFTPTKSNLVTDISTLATGQAVLESQMEELKKVLFKLHNDFHASKHEN